MERTRPKILIVDDMPANIQLLGGALKDRYRVSVATSGSLALEAVASAEPPDLILLDIVMPDMDGYEVCKRLKSRRETRDIPVIFITAKDQEEDETLGLELGAVDYITKPFSLPIVQVRVKSHLELKMQRDMLAELSMMDALTRLPNRRRLRDRLSLEWKRARRQSTPLGAMFIDVDNFKKYNDSYGHAMGDECLRMVSDKLAESFKRSTDMVARYGGEEFLGILPDTDLAGTMAMAERIRAGIESMGLVHSETGPGVVTVSIGVASMVPQGKDEPDILTGAADKALYRAKEAGRNRVEAEG